MIRSYELLGLLLLPGPLLSSMQMKLTFNSVGIYVMKLTMLWSRKWIFEIKIYSSSVLANFEGCQKDRSQRYMFQIMDLFEFENGRGVVLLSQLLDFHVVCGERIYV